MPELAEFHDFLHTALGNSEFGSVHQLLSQVRPYISKQRLYEICGGRELAKRDEVERLASTLSVPPARFHAVWEQARTAHEHKKLLSASARGAAVTPWRDDLPAPTGALLDLLRAQHEIGDAFPYRLLGVHTPPASKLLVKPTLQPVVTQPHSEKEDPAARRPVPLEVPLGKHEHLLMVAAPGYGKSMLGRSLVRQLGGRWLWTGEQAPTEEALVPLYIPATQIPATGAWSSRLAAAVGHNPYLVAEPGSALFADRVNEVRWLIVIDGLDEIHDPDRRHELLNALHQRILHSGPYRLVILSRPLPPGARATPQRRPWRIHPPAVRLRAARGVHPALVRGPGCRAGGQGGGSVP